MTSNGNSNATTAARPAGPTRTMRVAALALCGAGLVGLGACGSSSSHGASGSTTAIAGGSSDGGTTPSPPSNGSSSTSVDVCGLLSGADMSTLLGGTFTASGGTGGICNYKASNASFFVIVSTLAEVGGWSGAMQTLQQDGSDTPTAVHGVGDQAAYSGTQFDARSGNYLIDVHGADDADSTPNSWAHSTAVAKAIVAKLH